LFFSRRRVVGGGSEVAELPRELPDLFYGLLAVLSLHLIVTLLGWSFP
jgi:hypothetical protein